MRQLLIALFLAVATAAPAAQKTVAASSGWVKAPAAGDTTALAFVVVDNPTMYDVYILSAEADVAGKVELRRAVGDQAKPETLTAITAPAYGAVNMKPDGIYLLLSDLKKPLKAGDKVWLTLTTDAQYSVTVEAEVKPN